MRISRNSITGQPVESIVAVAEEFQAMITWLRPPEVDQPQAETSSEPAESAASNQQ